MGCSCYKINITTLVFLLIREFDLLGTEYLVIIMR